MAARPGFGQPDPRNPYGGPNQPYSQPSRQYSADSVGSDPYGSRNASQVPLADPNAYYDGQYTPQCRCPYLLSCWYRRTYIALGGLALRSCYDGTSHGVVVMEVLRSSLRRHAPSVVT